MNEQTLDNGVSQDFLEYAKAVHPALANPDLYSLDAIKDLLTEDIVRVIMVLAQNGLLHGPAGIIGSVGSAFMLGYYLRGQSS